MQNEMEFFQAWDTETTQLNPRQVSWLSNSFFIVASLLVLLHWSPLNFHHFDDVILNDKQKQRVQKNNLFFFFNQPTRGNFAVVMVGL